MKEKTSVRKYIHYLLSFPRSVIFNLKYLPFGQAIKFPILISHRAYIYKAKGNIEIQGPVSAGMIKIGFGEVGIFNPKKERCVWQVTGNITFKGKASIGIGSGLSIRGNLILGENFVITAKSNIICFKRIEFGSDCIVSWNNLITDTDFHKIYENGKSNQLNKDKEIKIGSKVWLGANCTVLKGSEIGNGCVAAAKSLINKKLEGANLLIGGNPARVLKENIKWER